MRIVYPPSEKTLAKLEEIRKLRETDPTLSVRKIANIVKIDNTYVSALLRWDKERQEKKI